LAVGWVIWPAKTVPEMTYNVFSGTLNPTHLLTYLPFGHNGHWPKIGGWLCPFRGGGVGSPSNTMSRMPRPTRHWHRTKWHVDPCRRLATTDVGRKLRGLCPFLGGRLGPHQTKSPWAETYLHTTWHHDASSRLATTEMNWKLAKGAAPLFREGAGFLCNTKSPGLRPTSVPSTNYIHPAVWPQ